MRLDIRAPGFNAISAILSAAGEEARLVGGCVRDTLIGIEPKDLDIATTALPDKVVDVATAAGYKVIPTGLQHGTVTIVHEGEPYEVTTLRTDVETDGRHAKVAYIRDWEQDAARRDFTINAMSVSPDGRLHDYFGGEDDIMSGTVRFVGDPVRRIQEDYLRILRFFRFRARFGTQMDGATFDAIQKNAHGLEDISVERVWMEMSKIITHPEGYGQVLMMDELGVLSAVGMNEDARYFSGLRKMIRHTDRPGMALGAMMSSERAVVEMVEKWKLSTSEANDALLTARILADFTDDEHYWICKAVGHASPQDMVPALKMNGLSSIADRIIDGVPEFPLMGRDLIAAGLRPGPALGQKLAEMKAAWMESGFELTRDELVDAALGNAAGGYQP